MSNNYKKLLPLITGIGVLSPCGNEIDELEKAILDFRPALSTLSNFEIKKNILNIGGKLDETGLKKEIPLRYRRKMSRISQIATISALHAVKDAEIPIKDINELRASVIVATAFGSTSQAIEFFKGVVSEGPRRANPFLFPDTVPNAPAGHISIVLSLTGFNTTITQNHISGESALFLAVEVLSSGISPMVIVTGADELSQTLFQIYQDLNFLREKENDDRNRLQDLTLEKGVILGEGAISIILETEENFIKRGGKKYYGKIEKVCIGGGEQKISRYEIPARGLEQLLRNMLPQIDGPIDQVIKTATFDRSVDRTEYMAIRNTLGDNISIFAPEYLTGTYGSAGILKIVTALILLRKKMQININPEIFFKSLPIVKAYNLSPKEDLKRILITGHSFGGGVATLSLVP